MSSVVTLHPETVKAALRVRYGALTIFAAKHGLKAQAVRDTLRGMSTTAIPQMAAELGIPADQLIISRDSTDVELHSSADASPHRLNAEAR